MAQGEEGKFENYGDDNVESLVMEQFRQCVSQILNQANNAEE